jgi:RNA polymerase sigma factor (sigma-70 family)
VLNSIRDDADIQKLYHLYANAILAYALQHTPSREDAEDLLLEVFLQALESENFALLNEEKQRTWLYRVAHNKAVDHYRRIARKQFIGLDSVSEILFEDEEQAPEQMALRHEEYTYVVTALKRLPEAQQKLLQLRFAHGLRCTEIATLLGKRESTVRTTLSRTLNHLRNML